MRSILATAVVVLTPLISACDRGGIFFNSTCTEYCFSVHVTENESQAEIDAAMKKACEDFGRHGTPQVLQKTKDEIGGTCPQ
jgi:hypothetical protein